MKFIALLSAGLIAASALAPTGASAQDRHDRRDRVVTRTVHVDRHRPAYRSRQVCRMERRDHRRVRICRTVRR
ncbi:MULTISPECIES: hypothetical protein [unclassified Sphingomonas]|uniref:hypothetical protein n=1 Tax=unclassified Sphingomonas TaxID=196159 RepID=UPI001F564752|nr:MULTISPECIES: hypothetical protein [unclassified Sphingomonas]